MESQKDQEKDHAVDADEGIALEMEVETTMFRQRAFEGYDDPVRMRLAADYSDQWFKEGDSEFNCYYVCMAHKPPCCSLIESKAWDRMHKDDLAAVGQRWYCDCLARYKTTWGVLVEIVMQGSYMYCRAGLPPESLKDAKAMQIQKSFASYKTPEALLAALPTIEPRDQKTFIKPHPSGRKGFWKFDNDQMKSLKQLEWNQLFNLQCVQDGTAAVRP